MRHNCPCRGGRGALQRQVMQVKGKKWEIAQLYFDYIHYIFDYIHYIFGYIALNIKVL